MRVAIHRQGFGVARGPGFGGMETQQAETIKGLRKLGVNIIFDWRKAKVIHVFGIYDKTPDLIRYFKQQGKLVVVSTIYWAWDEMHHNPHVLARQNERFKMSFSLADLLLPNSQLEADALTRNLGIAQDNMRVVVNAAPKDIEEQAATSKFELENGCDLKDYVLVVARIEGRKNQWGFLRAMAPVDVPIVLLGDCYEPQYYWACREMAARRKGRTEFFCGTPPPDLYKLMQGARVVALPSIYETPGLVCLEAAALGVPIAPTDRGTAMEYFGDDVIYLDPFSDKQLRTCVNPKGDRVPALKERVLRDYTWDRAAEQTLAAYKEVLGVSL